MNTLKDWIKNTEARLLSYKQLLEELNKNWKNLIIDPAMYDILDWYKAHLRDCKNQEETLLKKLITERMYENAGMNPPFIYHNN
jgi:hypothetical protein